MEMRSQRLVTRAGIVRLRPIRRSDSEEWRAARDADRDTSTPQYWAADEKGELKNQLDLKTLMGQRNPTEEELLAAIKAAA